MSDFSDHWIACMRGKGMPIPDLPDASLETVNEALEFLHKLHDAWEAAGGDEELLIGTVALANATPAMLEFAAAAAAAVVHLYVINGLVCLASVALSDLVSLNQQGEVPDFAIAELRANGTDLDSAVA